MTVVTSDLARGRPRTCPICGTANHACGGGDSVNGVVIRRADHRPRSGQMTRETRMVNGRAVLVQVPVYLKDDPDDGPETKKRPPAKDKKLSPAEPDDTNRPRPKIRTK